jgi:hypothetical protein
LNFEIYMKYIFVTGGVVSSLGKGLAAASIGTLLEHSKKPRTRLSKVTSILRRVHLRVCLSHVRRFARRVLVWCGHRESEVASSSSELFESRTDYAYMEV